MITVEAKELAKALKYASPLHNKLRDAVRARLKMSEQRMSTRWQQIARNEETFQSYIPEQEVDAARRRRLESSGIPDYRTIEIPYSYAVAMTAHTYYCSVFLARSPVLTLSGRHGEGEMKRVATESLLDYQYSVGQMALPMFIWLLDPSKAGYGVVMHHWDQELVRIRTKQKQPKSFMGVPLPGTEREVDVVEDIIGYEGNRLVNVRPQDWLPDPRVALVHFQKGEFCARYVETAWNEIYEGQRSGRFFNYDILKKMKEGRNLQDSGYPARDKGSEKVTELPDEVQVEAGYDVPVGFVKGHEIYLRLIPDEWKIGKGDRQEIWVFNISSSGVVFGAVPLGEFSNKFPFDIQVDEVDGYSIFPKGMVERCKPLSDVITWLINSHFYNVRQTLNNQFIYDPSMVVNKDVENPEPGKAIRLKPSAYGRDVRTILSQLQTVDVTQRHPQDVILMQQFIQRVTGVNDTVMGMVNQGDRTTATEVRHSTTFGINRLKTQCEWYSAVGWGPMTQKLVQRTQQFYNQAKKIRLVGDQAQFGPGFLDVTPEMIAGFWDFEPVDGTLPVDRFAQANLWATIMQQMGAYPQILLQYDIAKIFAWVARLGGIKNLAQFKLIPDSEVNKQVLAGNIVPIGTASKEAGNKNLNEPKQIPTLGATG